jgi:hypothetical protein
MWRVVTGMTSMFVVYARTGLSPEWDRGFDEAFTDLVTADPDWVRDEFDALIGATFGESPEPPEPPAPPAPPTGHPGPPHWPADNGGTTPAPPAGRTPAKPDTNPRSPP